MLWRELLSLLPLGLLELGSVLGVRLGVRLGVVKGEARLQYFVKLEDEKSPLLPPLSPLSPLE